MNNIRIIPWAIIIFIIMPIVINFLCLSHVPFPIIGNGLSWLAFWGSYLGGGITVFATFLVLQKNHNRDYFKKEYELQEKYFNSLCASMAELCTAINVDQLTYLFLDLNDDAARVQNIRLLGKTIRAIKGTYNKFVLQYAHNGGKAKEDLLGYYESVSNKIEAVEEILLMAHVNLSTNKINGNEFNEKVNLCLCNLKDLGDVTTQVFLLASKWKRQEWDILERMRKQYLDS